MVEADQLNIHSSSIQKNILSEFDRIVKGNQDVVKKAHANLKQQLEYTFLHVQMNNERLIEKETGRKRDQQIRE